MGPFCWGGRSFESRDHSSLDWNEKKNAVCEFAKGRQFLDAALGPAFGAASQALHAACHKNSPWIFKCQVDVVDWGLASSNVSRSGSPRVSPSLGLGINAFKCQIGAGGWRLASSMFPEATIHASALHWALTFVRELSLTVLISEPLIMGFVVCL